MKMRFKRFLSGFMAVATLASTIIQPVTVSASELEPEKIPFEQQYAELKDVQDSLDPNEIVKANDIELSYGQEFDVEVDLSGIEGVDESKIKILFHEAKNEAGTDFDTHTPDTYKAVYAVEPVSGHPAYRVSRNITVKEPETEQPKAAYTDKDSDKKEKSAIPYLIATIIIVLLLCGGAILFIYYPDLFSSSSDSDKDIVDMPEAVQPVQPEAQLSDTIVQKDTVAEAAPVMPDETVQPKPVVKKEPAAEPVKAESKPAQQQQPATSVYSDSASYKITGTKTKYTIKEGETLTRVSLRFYGTKAMWPYIVKHNPKVIKNPDNVPYGTTIEIPELTKE